MKRQHRGTIVRLFTCANALLLLGGVWLPVQSARASCVVPMNMMKLADGAGQVIVGRVTSIRSYWTANPRTIESQVSFDQVEYLKGRPIALAPGTFVLRVPGGSVDGTTMQLCCAPKMSVGQTWLLFLQPTYKTHPVVGLSQGAFQLVEQINGAKLVQAASGVAVLGLDDVGYVRVASGEVSALDRLRSTHRVRIVNVKPTPASQPIDWPSFRTLIEPILANSLDYHLTAPAGQPNHSALIPTMLQNAPAGGSFISAKAKNRTLTLPSTTTVNPVRASQAGRRISTDHSVVPMRNTGRSDNREAPK